MVCSVYQTERPISNLALGPQNGVHFSADARPSIALHSNSNAVANCLAATEHVVESPLVGVDDDGSSDARGRIIHYFAWNDAIKYAKGSLKRPHLVRCLRTSRTDANQCAGDNYAEQANLSHHASTPRM